MMTSAECRARAAVARAAAQSTGDKALRRHFMQMARDWGLMADRAAVQEVMEAALLERENSPQPDH